MIKIPARKHSDECECEDCLKIKKAVSQSNGNTVIFDCETIPQNEENLLKIMPVFEPDSRLKDPAKIEDNLKKQRENWFRDAALDWKTANVVLIGVGDGVRYAPITGTEEQVITSFFQMVTKFIESETFFGGHAVKNFDLPMLVNRARVLRIPLPEGLLTFYRGRSQWNPFLFDTLEIISFGERMRIEGNGVDDVCRALGVQGKIGDGANFPELWKKNQAGGISYNKADIMAEVEIAKLCGYKFGN